MAIIKKTESVIKEKIRCHSKENGKPPEMWGNYVSEKRITEYEKKKNEKLNQI